MHGSLLSIQHHTPSPSLTFPASRSILYSRNHTNTSIPSCTYGYRADFKSLLLFCPEGCGALFKNSGSRRRNRLTLLRATRRESPYEVLGVSPSATSDEIKRAYRKLALKYHPDVNKEENAKDNFMRIKHAYNMLLNSESRRKYDSGNSSGFSYSGSQTSQSRTTKVEEEFYGFEDFFKDLQQEFRNWEASAPSHGKPKSLWEELAEIGEEFVEFLEKELSITDTTAEASNSNEQQKDGSFNSPGGKRTGNTKDTSIEDNIDEIEATLANLKKELGL